MPASPITASPTSSASAPSPRALRFDGVDGRRDRCRPAARHGDARRPSAPSGSHIAEEGQCRRAESGHRIRRPARGGQVHHHAGLSPAACPMPSACNCRAPPSAAARPAAAMPLRLLLSLRPWRPNDLHRLVAHRRGPARLRATSRSRPLLLEQGLIQRLWAHPRRPPRPSAQQPPRQPHRRRWPSPPPDVIVRVDTPYAVAAARIHARPRGNSRYERLAEAEIIARLGTCRCPLRQAGRSLPPPFRGRHHRRLRHRPGRGERRPHRRLPGRGSCMRMQMSPWCIRDNRSCPARGGTGSS